MWYSRNKAGRERWMQAGLLGQARKGYMPDGLEKRGSGDIQKSLLSTLPVPLKEEKKTP